jgi:isopenicillin N synthase-like dioxygenase
MSQATIPVLDLKDYIASDSARQADFVRGVGDSLVNVGFFALTNHGLDKSLIEQAYEQSANLFHLAETSKAGYEKAELKGQRGYTSFGKEHAKDSAAPDLKEFWHVGQELAADHPLAATYPANIWPHEVPQFKPTMLDLFHQLEQCALTLLEACALYIDEPRDRFRKMAETGNSILRLIHYPPIPEDVNPQSVRAGAHEDINLITLLIDATSSGLEIKDRLGQWLPVVTPPDCIIVDAGDMLQNVTNGYFKSTTHRVVNPEDSREPRFSMPFFVHARSEVDLSPLASCVKLTGGTRQYPNISAGDYLHQRLVEIGLA